LKKIAQYSFVIRQPARQEACNQQRCSDLEMVQPTNFKRSGMPAWLMSLVTILGIVAIGGIAFTSYTYYMRYALLLTDGLHCFWLSC
jgi:hypothetical protein